MGTTHTPKVAILASGSGTTAEAFIHATQDGTAEAQVALVISNNPRAGVLERVGRLNKQYGLSIKALHVNGLTHPEGAGRRGQQTLQESAAIAAAIEKAGCEFVALMGYMKEIRGLLLQRFGWQPDQPLHTAKMLNTHPGPLPHTAALYGLGIQEWVLKNSLGYSAHTVHAVSAGYDTGDIIAEHQVPVRQDDTPESLFARVQETEKHHLPRDIHNFIHSGEVQYAHA